MEQRAASREHDAARHRWWWLVPCLVLMAGCDGWREPDVARVNGTAISQNEVRVELRGLFWRRGEAWEALDAAARKVRRQEALDRCVEHVLLGSLVTPATGAAPGVERESEEAFQQFLKQFEAPEGWKPRFELQGVGEVAVRGLISQEVARTSAVEDLLKAQETRSPAEAEKEAQEWFSAHREEMRVPARAKVSHVFLTGHVREKPDRTAEITELHRKLTAGEATLEGLAARFSEDERSKKVGGSLGWIDQDRVPADFAEKVFALPIGQLSAPFRTGLGWHLLVVHERKASRLPEFSEVKAEVMARLDLARRETAVKRLVKELRDKAQIVVNEAVLGVTE